MGTRFISSHFCEGNLSKPESVQVKAGYLPGRVKSIFKFICQRKSGRKRTLKSSHSRSGENNFPVYVMYEEIAATPPGNGERNGRLLT